MSVEPWGQWPPVPEQIDSIEQAYEALRIACDRLEVIMERDQEHIPHKAFKRCDKAIVVMKMGFKSIKKAIGYKKQALRVVA